MKEGEDYYFNEAGLMVLTAKYLSERGYCCGNGCRHCPYEQNHSKTSAHQPADIKEN